MTTRSAKGVDILMRNNMSRYLHVVSVYKLDVYLSTMHTIKHTGTEQFLRNTVCEYHIQYNKAIVVQEGKTQP